MARRKKIPKYPMAHPSGRGNRTRQDLRNQLDLQAERVLDRLGGPMNIIRVMRSMEHPRQWDPSTLYYWTYTKAEGGTGGIIPAYAVAILMEVARYEGVLLTADDFYPGLK